MGHLFQASIFETTTLNDNVIKADFDAFYEIKYHIFTLPLTLSEDTMTIS